jgi:hypothetical protein
MAADAESTPLRSVTDTGLPGLLAHQPQGVAWVRNKRQCAIRNDASPRKKHSEFHAQLGQRLVGIALFRAVELPNSSEMNFGHPNLVIGVLLLLLFFRHEFTVPELALHGLMSTQT